MEGFLELTELTHQEDGNRKGRRVRIAFFRVFVSVLYAREELITAYEMRSFFFLCTPSVSNRVFFRQKLKTH